MVPNGNPSGIEIASDDPSSLTGMDDLLGPNSKNGNAMCDKTLLRKSCSQTFMIIVSNISSSVYMYMYRKMIYYYNDSTYVHTYIAKKTYIFVKLDLQQHPRQ